MKMGERGVAQDLMRRLSHRILRNNQLHSKRRNAFAPRYTIPNQGRPRKQVKSAVLSLTPTPRPQAKLTRE